MKKVILLAAAIIVVLLSTTYIYSEEKASVKKPPIIKPQFFCGYCHILTYPKVIKKAHASWKTGKHKEVSCEECHYPPERIDVIIPEHKRIPEDEKAASKKKTELEFMKTELEVLSGLITILNMEESTVRTRPRVDDRSCTTSECHPTTGKGKEGEYWTKKIPFTEFEREDKSKATVSFTHEAHFEKEKWVEGQEMHCSTCHRHETGKKHIDVSREGCYLCHFKNLALNEKRSKCSLCHKIPEEPFKKAEKPDEKAITHKELENRNVSCASCHMELVKGNGVIKQEKCLDCHENEESIMKEEKNIKLMHEKHVAAQTAHCFSCHEPIQHKKGTKEFTYVDAALNNCNVCHPEPHLNQRLLIAGEGGTGVDKPYPIKHHNVRTNCIACHVRDAVDEKGRKIKKADTGTCVACHTENEGKLPKKWKSDVLDVIEVTREIEQETVKAIEEARDRLPEIRIKKAMALLSEGRENLRIVQAGGGVHNKKYSVLLLDIAMEKFDLAIEEVN
jgi:hypothetical protein